MDPRPVPPMLAHRHCGDAFHLRHRGRHPRAFLPQLPAGPPRPAGARRSSDDHRRIQPARPFRHQGSDHPRPNARQKGCTARRQLVRFRRLPGRHIWRDTGIYPCQDAGVESDQGPVRRRHPLRGPLAGWHRGAAVCGAGTPRCGVDPTRTQRLRAPHRRPGAADHRLRDRRHDDRSGPHGPVAASRPTAEVGGDRQGHLGPRPLRDSRSRRRRAGRGDGRLQRHAGTALGA